MLLKDADIFTLLIAHFFSLNVYLIKDLKTVHGSFFGEIFEKFNLNLLYRGLGTYPTQVKTILSKGAKNGLKDKGIER